MKVSKKTIRNMNRKDSIMANNQLPITNNQLASRILGKHDMINAGFEHRLLVEMAEIKDLRHKIKTDDLIRMFVDDLTHIVKHTPWSPSYIIGEINKLIEKYKITMSNYNINLNLSKLKDSFVAAINGKTATKKCLCIPLDSDGVYVGEKGIYLDLSAIETKEQKFNQSHFIRVSLPKEVYQQLTEEERKQVPIVGNMKVLERPAVQNQEVEAATVASVEPDEGMSIDYLPF